MSRPAMIHSRVPARFLLSSAIAVLAAALLSVPASAGGTAKLSISGNVTGTFSLSGCSQQVISSAPVVTFTLNLSGQVQPNLYRYGLTVGYPSTGTWNVGKPGAKTSARLEYNYGPPGDTRVETTWYSTKGTFTYGSSHSGSLKITLAATTNETPSVVTVKGTFTCLPLNL